MVMINLPTSYPSGKKKTYPNKRDDDHGIFWDNEPKEKKKGGGSVSLYRPPIPDTGWKLPGPEEFREFHRSGMIAIDIETYDPDLKSKGPGVRRDGRIVGVAIGMDDGWRRYFPIGHETGPNLEADKVRDYVVRELSLFKGPIVGANLLYDLDYLTAHWGVDIRDNQWWDVQTAEPLIDENAFSYSLEALSQKYLGEGKEGDAMYDWLALVFGGSPTRSDQAPNIWRAPTALAGPYAESDTDLPMRIIGMQLAKIQEEGLDRVWDIERRLTPLLLAMRQRGVRVDLNRAEELMQQLATRADESRVVLENHGIGGPWNRDEIAAYCDSVGLPYRMTQIGAPSFPKAWIEAQTDPVIATIREVRRLDKLGGTFVKNYILGHHIDGRLHCQFNQLRSDSGGAVSGRFSSSHPNLQNIPARDEELGPLIRGLWIPEEGEDWASDDYSQIEYRLAVHYGKGESADRVRQQYRVDNSTDFHVMVAEMCGIGRKDAKNINFGLLYGMGEKTMAANLGRPLDEVKPIFEQYHSIVPFVKELYDLTMRVAANRGFVKTLLGRRRRFDLWEPARWIDPEERNKDPEAYKPTSDKDKALEKFGRIKRAMTNKALNSILQGGAADIMKISMVHIWESGVCDVLGAPLLTVHDELNWSRPRTREGEQAHKEALRLMEQAYSLKIPLRVSSAVASDWGAAK